MTRFAESYAVWLADYYLLATFLLALALVGMASLKQPAQRLAIIKSTLVSLILLALLCAIPGWSVMHLLTYKQPQPVAESPGKFSTRPVPQATPTPPLLSDALALVPKDSAVPPTSNSQPERSIDFHLSWPALFATTHLAGAACIALWLSLGWFASARLRHTARPAPPDVIALLNEVFEQTHGSSPCPQLLTHHRIDVAVALGAWRPTILLPSRWTRGESQVHLRTVLAHESTHILNHDPQWVALTRILFTALWANPLFWIARRWLRRDQEALADAAAAKHTSRQRYAEQLVAWARDVSSRQPLHLSSAVGLWERPSQLRQRIALLLNERLTVIRECSRRWRLGSFAMGGILAFGLSLVTLRLAEPLPAIAEEKQSTTADGAKPIAKVALAEMGTLKVSVLDANDQPIKGAKVKPYGMRSNNDGGHYAWFTERPGLVSPAETTTDDDGIATVRYPRNVDEERPVTVVSLQLNHPEFVSKTQDVPIGDTPSKVRLQQGGMVEITVEGGDHPKIDELFGAGGSWGAHKWTHTNDGKLRSPHLSDKNDEWTRPGGPPNDGGQDVRVVWLPKDRPAQFSPVEHVQIREGETQSIQVRLRPGVKLAGSLEEDVPRPIVDGKVVVVADSAGQTDWHDWAPINEDGTFEFESLPSDDQHDLQIMAYCDGYISTTGAEDGIQLKPKKLRLNKDLSGYVVEMEPTATAVAKLLDPEGKPVRGAKIYFSPNIFWSIGSNIVGSANYRTRDALLDPEYFAKLMKERPGLKFQAATDEQGVAKVANLPAYPYQMMSVEHERFQLPRADGPGVNRYFSFMNLSPGDSTEETIKLEAKSDKNQKKADAKPTNNEPAKAQGTRQPPLPQPNAKQRSEERRPPNTITGRVVDEKGQPIAGAEALLFRVNRIDSSRKLQAKTTTDAAGNYRFENVVDIAKEFPGRKFNPLNHTFDPLEEELVQVYVRAPGRVAGMQMDLRQQIALAGDTFNMALKPAATLTGRVTGPDGKPVGGALVSIGGSGYSTWDEVASARTKADGTYVISDAAPYGIEEYRKQAAEQNRKMEAARNAKQNTYSIYVMPPVLTVSHPDFATKYAIYQKIPGTQDVKLDPAAVLEGHVIYGDSGKPAVGAIVHLSTPQPKDARPGEDSFTPNPFASDARTDAEGKYRFVSLPAGSYDVSAEMRGWVNVGIDKFTAASSKTSTAPNLVLTQGGMISVRLINDETGKPLELQPEMRASISAHRFPFGSVSRPAWNSMVPANAAGRFELRSPAGKRAVLAMGVHVGNDLKWIGKSPGEPGEFKPPVVDVVEGKTVELDLLVAKMPTDPAATITGTFQVAPATVKEPAKEDQGATKRGRLQNGAQIQLVQNTTPAAEKPEVKRPPGVLGYGDDKPDGKKSIGGSGEMIQFELPKGVTKIKGIRIHGSRYGLPQAPKEDFEITFLNEKWDETLHAEAAPYRLFNRGKEQWVRVVFKDEVELPRKFWVCLNFNAAQTKGVYVSYDTSTKGKYSRVGLPGDKEVPKETDFKGDWMVQLLLAKPEK